jgi:DNA-binding NarL/FixJ family response regulator
MEREARAAGADGYVTKMSATDKLLSAMKSLFESPQVAALPEPSSSAT